MSAPGGSVAAGAAGAADRPRITFAATTLDSPDARALAAFYARLLGWEVGEDHADWVTLIPPPGQSGLSFQTEDRYERPTWPAAEGHQQMQLHLELHVEDLDAAVAHAVAAGAELPEFQPQDDVRVLLDPAGHPFCLYL